MDILRVVIDGVLRQRWDDNTEIYTAWDDRDVQIEQRSYNPDELAQKAARVEAATVAANEADIGSKIETVDMPAMQAILDATNATINAGPAPYLKDIAKAVRRLDRKVQRLLDGST